jgi:CheY-like chemotaxis protein
VTPAPRPPLKVELGYRSDAALLVAYATQLVKNELLVKTELPVRSGTPIELKLNAPAASIGLRGVVASSRADSGGNTQVAALEVTVTSSTEAMGDAVDRLAFGFQGITALVAASQAAPRAHLIRYLRAIINCHVVEVDQSRLSEPGAIGNVDLALIDLDSSGTAGYELYAQLRQHEEARTAPVLALAQLERDRLRAASLGFDEALANPPAFAELQSATLRCLAKPYKVFVVES